MSEKLSSNEINESLQFALEETLQRAKGAEMYLTGGTAANIYSKQPVRPLSFDLDFMILHDPSQPAKHAREVQALFDVNYVRFEQKKTFKSMKAIGKASNDCDLDFIVDQKVIPDEAQPEANLQLFISTEMKNRIQEREFEGVKVRVVPPEYVVLAKLFAGRGIDIDKYDLIDSAAIMNNFEENHFNPIALLNDLEFYLVNTHPGYHQIVKKRIAYSLENILNGTEAHGLNPAAYEMIQQLHNELIK